jgi:hypothetical protein
MTITPRHLMATSFMLLGGIALAACSESPEKTFETRTEDKSGGEFIVTDANREGVEVELPKTEMTPVAPANAPNEPVGEIDMMEEGD